MRWQIAANLILDFESVSTSFVGAALCPTLIKVSAADKLTMASMRLAAANVMLSKGLEVMSRWAMEFDTDECLSASDPNASIFGTVVMMPLEKKFTVSSQPVSIHISLHRFIAKVLLFVAAGDVPIDLRAILSIVPAHGIAALFEYPMRCLALSAQVQVGMWRRNGGPVANLVYNYSRVPLCRSLRDADLVLMQAAVVRIGPDAVIALALRRLEISTFVFSSSIEMMNDVLASKKTFPHIERLGGLLAEFFRLLATITTHLPSPIMKFRAPGFHDSSGRADLLHQPLAREIAHLLLSGAQKVAS